jgi:hypothetical protein
LPYVSPEQLLTVLVEISPKGCAIIRSRACLQSQLSASGQERALIFVVSLYDFGCNFCFVLFPIFIHKLSLLIKDLSKAGAFYFFNQHHKPINKHPKPGTIERSNC